MGKLRKACANCIKYKLACETKRPCSRCVLHQCSCIDVERKPRAARRPKRPRTSIDGVDETVSAASLASSGASSSSSSSSSMSSASSSSASSILSPSTTTKASPYIPELVLNDNEPLFSSSFDSSFMMQPAEATIPYNDFGYLHSSGNNSFLSSVLMLDHDQASLGAPLLPKVEPGLGLFGADDFVRKPEYVKPTAFLNAALPNSTNVAGAANKFVIREPQPLVILNKAEWEIMDCNLEFAQFLGYNSISELNHMDLLAGSSVAEALGLSKQYGQAQLPSHFDRVATLKSKDGTERTVTLRADSMDKLIMFTIKEVYEMRPMCFYSRWLKAVAPNAITPCDRVRCQCRFYDYMQTAQALQPLSLNPQSLQQPLTL